MIKFCKIIESEKFGQILIVKNRNHELGCPIIQVTYQSERLGRITNDINFEDQESANKYFNEFKGFKL